MYRFSDRMDKTYTDHVEALLVNYNHINVWKKKYGTPTDR